MPTMLRCFKGTALGGPPAPLCRRLYLQRINVPSVDVYRGSAAARALLRLHVLPERTYTSEDFAALDSSSPLYSSLSTEALVIDPEPSGQVQLCAPFTVSETNVKSCKLRSPLICLD
jgi:hypothetical protein